MSSPPTFFRAHRDRRLFEIGWEGEIPGQIPFKSLRSECPCAMCVDEMTGVRIIRPEQVPDDVAPIKLEPAGNYALRIAWSDGHATGIYTWDRLHQLTRQFAS